MEFTIRQATLDDCPAIEKLVALSVRGLSTEEYTPGLTIEFVPMKKMLKVYDNSEQR